MDPPHQAQPGRPVPGQRHLPLRERLELASRRGAARRRRPGHRRLLLRRAPFPADGILPFLKSPFAFADYSWVVGLIVSFVAYVALTGRLPEQAGGAGGRPADGAAHLIRSAPDTGRAPRPTATREAPLRRGLAASVVAVRRRCARPRSSSPGRPAPDRLASRPLGAPLRDLLLRALADLGQPRLEALVVGAEEPLGGRSPGAGQQRLRHGRRQRAARCPGPSRPPWRRPRSRARCAPRTLSPSSPSLRRVFSISSGSIWRGQVGGRPEHGAPARPAEQALGTTERDESGAAGDRRRLGRTAPDLGRDVHGGTRRGLEGLQLVAQGGPRR